MPKRITVKIFKARIYRNCFSFDSREIVVAVIRIKEFLFYPNHPLPVNKEDYSTVGGALQSIKIFNAIIKKTLR